MKARLLKKWRKNWVISLDIPFDNEEEDKYFLHDWNKPNNGKMVVNGTLKDCLDYEHRLLMSYLDDFERKRKNTICSRIS